MPIGMAFASGRTEGGLPVWRLTVDGDDVPGLFIAAGPNIKHDVRLMGFEVSVFDLAPTILHLYGIRKPPQMKGHVISAIFESPTSAGGY